MEMKMMIIYGNETHKIFIHMQKERSDKIILLKVTQCKVT